MATPTMKSDCDSLRQVLKEWEKQFSAQNGGRKASRDDIKSCPDIAAKYKEYNKLRAILSGSRAGPSPAKRQTARGEHHSSSCRQPPSTPSRARQTSGSCDAKALHDNQHMSAILKSPTPKPETPAISRTMIGPTPQRNGVVIGLFDMLSSETPTKNTRSILTDIATNTIRTPSRKPAPAEDEQCFTGNHKGSKTPMSAGKRFFLDKFAATPMKRKRDDDEGEVGLKHSSTPTFLRRDQNLERISEGEEDKTPRPLPWRRTGFVRSLSSMIQGLKDRNEEERQREEDRLDEELDLLRELEAEQAGEQRPAKKHKVLVEDSQAVEMPLGPDKLVHSDDDEVSDGTHNQRLWKKGGLKRQTKRVNIKPVRMKTLPEIETQDEAVEESQAICNEEPESGDEHDRESNDENSEMGDDPTLRSGKTDNIAKQSASKAKNGKIVQAVRKVNQQAHANFRKLKIKNKNSKAQGRGRFGRNRR